MCYIQDFFLAKVTKKILCAKNGILASGISVGGTRFPSLSHKKASPNPYATCGWRQKRPFQMPPRITLPCNYTSFSMPPQRKKRQLLPLTAALTCNAANNGIVVVFRPKKIRGMCCSYREKRNASWASPFAIVGSKYYWAVNWESGVWRS